jgi:hypothetical protein
MWIIILGITTVGYGDITPVSQISRLITALGCFIGNVILILMTVVISNMINHNEKELRAYSFIGNFENRYILRDHAVVLLQRYFRYNMNFVQKKSASINSSLVNNEKPKKSNNTLLVPKGDTILLKNKLSQAVERFREYREVWCNDPGDLGNGFSKMKESLDYIDIIKVA